MRTLLFFLLCSRFVFADYQHFEARQVHPLTMTPDGSTLVAVDSSTARVTVFDLSSGTPVRSGQIPVGLEPVTAKALTNDEIWVVNEGGDNVSILSLASRTVVETLKVGDEPTDVVFAAGKAFITCARDSQIRVLDTSTRAQLGTISVNGVYPHALAVNAAGTRLYAACLHSGNRTTVISKEAAPPQPDPTNPNLPPPPDTALIVPTNDPRVTLTVLDHDVVEVDTSSHAVLRYVSDVGTNLFDLAPRPGSDEVWVTNTEARNLIRFEPVLKGHFVDNRVSIVTPTTVSAVDLNPGVDYGLLPNPSAQATALAQPVSAVFSADGATLWVGAFASDRIAQLDAATGAVLNRVDLRTGAVTDSSAMRGPRGLVLDEARSQLYVLNKLSSTLTVVHTTTLAVQSELALSSYDPMPRAVREGRGFLFDARLSGNGTTSCGICHIDADRDGLAWDLGDPGGEMLTVLGKNLSVHDTTPRPRVMHPMKGPMVTQTLRGMQNGDPFHWRGDKPTLQSFNPTFANLMGGSQVPTDDMDDLAAYLFSLVHHSNPNRNLDRTLPSSFASGDPNRGRDLFNDHLKSHCAVCHVTPEGTDHNIDLPQESGLSQPVKNPPLRTTYQRLFFPTPDSKILSGFGLLHDGTGRSRTLPTVHPYVLDNLNTSQEFADVSSFIRCFDTGTAKTVGYARTITTGNRTLPAALADLSLLEARAVASFVDCDLIVRGKVGGVEKTYFWKGTGYQGEVESVAPISRAALLASLSGSDSLTFMGVLPGAGFRLSIDEDEDLVLNADDPEPGVVNGPPRLNSEPQNLAVAPGAMAQFSVDASGSGLQYQWRRGTTLVGTNAPIFTIASASAAHAGSYTVTVSNEAGSRTSNSATLKVVAPPVITKQPTSRNVNEGSTVSFSVVATGSNLSYQWRRGSSDISGAKKSTLTLPGVGAQDVGTYSVVVSNGDTSATSVSVSLSVNLWPVVNDLILAPAIIGQDYIEMVTATNGPTKFNISGLPSGLVADPSTGSISGRPNLAKNYTVRVSATNAYGTGAVKQQVVTVHPYPTSALGTYRGIIGRQTGNTIVDNLGGYFKLTTTNLGTCSGTLQLGSKTYSFAKRLTMLPDQDPGGLIVIERPGRDSLTLSFTLVRATRELQGQLSDLNASVEFTAKLHEDQRTGFTGAYTFALSPSAEETGPRGHSVGAFKVSSLGYVTGVLRLATGAPALLLSTRLVEGAEIPLFKLAHSGSGSVLGTLKIGSERSLATSQISWFKQPQSTSRSYPDGFGPLALTTIGGAYQAPPQGGIALGLTPGPGNAQLHFLEGELPDPSTRVDWASFRIKAGNPAIIVPPTSNPGLVKMSVRPGSGTLFIPGQTGSFSGSLKLIDLNTQVTPNQRCDRSAIFFGMIVRDGTQQKGFGFFNLAEMPTDGPPKISLTTSPIHSGAVLLQSTAP